MALSNNRPQRIVVLCAMYVAQGLPWGFMVTAIVAYLTDTDKTITDTEIGALTAMTLLPWTFKLVWAPLIDSVTIRSMGRRRPWIIGAECMMAVSLVAMLSVGELNRENMVVLGWWFFIHNCFASLQDVATDALAIDVLATGEHGRVNGLMWGSKLFGKGVGAGISGWMLVEYGFAVAVWVQFAFLMGIMLFPLSSLERPGEKQFPWSRGQASAPDGLVGSFRNPLDVMADLIKGFSLRSTLFFGVFGVFAVVGWGIIEVATKPLYTQDLGWNSKDYSKVAGWGVSMELLGAIIGGWLADKIDRRWVMSVGFGLYGILALIFAANPDAWHIEAFAIGFLFLNPGVLALGSVGYNSMGMRVSWTKASATMFTIYMTMSNIGHVVGNYVYGILRDNCQYSYQETFDIAGRAMLLPLFLLPLIKPRQIDEHSAIDKQVETDNAQATASAGRSMFDEAE